jgi:hypothetical protein
VLIWCLVLILIIYCLIQNMPKSKKSKFYNRQKMHSLMTRILTNIIKNPRINYCHPTPSSLFTWGALPSDVKQSGMKLTTHLPLCAKIKNGWTSTSTPPIYLLDMYKDNFTLLYFTYDYIIFLTYIISIFNFLQYYFFMGRVAQSV